MAIRHRGGATRRIVIALGGLARWRLAGILTCFVGLIVRGNLAPPQWSSGTHTLSYKFDPANPPVTLSARASDSPGVVDVSWGASREAGIFSLPRESCWCSAGAPVIGGGFLNVDDIDALRPLIADRVRAERLGRLDDTETPRADPADMSEQLALAVTGDRTAPARSLVRISRDGAFSGSVVSGNYVVHRIYWPWIGWSVAAIVLLAGIVFFAVLDVMVRLVRVYYRAGIADLRSNRCPHCQYSLAGGTGTQCPECGTVFEDWHAQASAALF